MSQIPARGQSSTSNRENRENRPKLVPKAGSQKRNVLGNVTNNVRRQPLRAAKDKHAVVPTKPVSCGQENRAPSQAKKAGTCGQAPSGTASFAIFEDARVPPPMPLVHNDVAMHDQENIIPEHELVLNDAVTGLNRPTGGRHAPLQPLELEPVPDSDVCGDSSQDSPMAVDHVKERETSVGGEYGLDPYAEDIYNYLRSVEADTRPPSNYMTRQNDVSTSMRNILVDWLVEVGEEYRLQRETLFLAIAYIDKFLSLVGVQRPKLQLVGAASMFIASKYEEIYPPDVGEFVYITDDTYTKRQVLKMESVILKLLGFKVAIPTINWFCERFMETVEMKERTRHLTFFLAELSLIEVEEFLNFPPSVIAAGCIILARSTIGELPTWSPKTEVLSGYSVDDLGLVVSALYNLFSRCLSMPQQAVVEKYKHEKYGCVSLLQAPTVLSIN